MYRNLLLPAAMAIAAPAQAATAQDGPLHTIVNVDIIPAQVAVGARILADHIRDMRHDPAVVSVTLIRQDGGGNHFILDVTFASRAAYERHISAETTRQFRASLFPHLGSPWDERTGTDLSD